MEVIIMRFPIVLHTDDGIRYGVTVPDIKGCYSTGYSMDDAIDSIQEAIDLHLEGMADDGENLPVASSITAHKNNPDYANGIWALVDIDMNRYEGKSEKINITMPKNLIRRIDDYVQSHGLTRSGFLADTARQAVYQLRRKTPSFRAEI
jgi:predicted RNase H-like HicB family nuclease